MGPLKTRKKNIFLFITGGGVKWSWYIVEIQGINEKEDTHSSSSVVEVENWTKWKLFVNTFNHSSHKSSILPSDTATSQLSSHKIIYAGARDQISLESKVINIIYTNSSNVNTKIGVIIIYKIVKL